MKNLMRSVVVLAAFSCVPATAFAESHAETGNPMVGGALKWSHLFGQVCGLAKM